MPLFEELRVFSGSAHRELAQDICDYLKTPLGDIQLFKFANDNTFIQFQENIRQRDVFLIQPFAYPVNDKVMELLIMMDAAKRASAGRITAIIPYYAYGRTDKKDQPRVPITARLVADLLTTAGADRVLTVDLHAGQIQGFFNIPVPTWAGRLGRTNEAGLKTPTASSSFWIGALATLLATPCSAPFLGTAAGFALSRGPVEIFVVFATLGIGMATPYLVLAAIPAFATRLPKPGAWMIWVRNLMGVSLVGTIIWLLSVITAQIGYLGAIALGTLMVTCGVILGLAKRREAAEGRFSLGAIGVISVIALIIPQTTSSLSSRTNNEEIIYSYWEKLDVSAIEPLVEAGNTVFVDITADWCLTCKVNKSLVLDKAEIVDQMTLPGIVAMRGDWTKPDPIIAEYLESFGRYGLPFNVIYGPGTPLGLVLPELLSKAAILSGLQQARTTADGASKQ